MSHFNVLLAVRLVIIASPELNTIIPDRFERFGLPSDGWTDPDDTKKRVPMMSNISNKFNVIDQSKFRKKKSDLSGYRFIRTELNLQWPRN